MDMTKINYKELSEKLGNIPTKNNVIKEIKRIEKIQWFKPIQEPTNFFHSKIQMIIC